MIIQERGRRDPGHQVPQRAGVLHRPLGPPGRRPARRQGRQDLQRRGRQRLRHVDAAGTGARLRRRRRSPQRTRGVHVGDGRGEGPAGLRVLCLHAALSAGDHGRRAEHGRRRPQRPGARLHHLGQRPADPAGRADRRRARRTTATTAPTRGRKPAASSARTTSPSPSAACRRSRSAAGATCSRAARKPARPNPGPTPPTSYHQPADEFDPSWDPKGFVADGTLLFELGQKLANARTWPEWKAGAEFKAERDKTAAARK